MTRPKQGISLAIVILWALFVSLGSVGSGAAAVTPYRCRVPPVVSQLAKPNIMLLVDFSGSMQWPAYWYDGSRVRSVTNYTTYDNYFDDHRQYFGVYDNYLNYYGYFDSAAYYKYTGANEQPYDTFIEMAPTGNVDTESNTYIITHMKIVVTNPNGSAEPDGDETYKGYFKYDKQNATDAAVAVDDCVVIRNVPGQGKFVNDKSFKVIEADSASKVFAVDVKPWRDELPRNDDDYVEVPPANPETDGGIAITRVAGNFTDGISGNFLNFASMSRMDNTLMALIGGREADKDTQYSYIEAQSSRNNVRENTNLNVDIYIRPGDYTDQSSFDTEAYNHGDTNYNHKVTFLSVSNHYRGDLQTSDPHTKDPACSATNAVAEMYRFTVARDNTRFKIEMRPNDPGASDMHTRINMWDSEPTGSNNPRWKWSGSTGNPTRQWIKLDHGTYWLEATTFCDNSHPYGQYTLIINADLEIIDGDASWGSLANPNHDGQLLNTTGALPFARVRVRKDLAKRTGVIQSTFDRVRYGFAHFSTWWKPGNGQGLIEIGCENGDMDMLIAALERKYYDATHDFSRSVHYSGTPTGPAVYEMSDYFKQNNKHHMGGTGTNSNFIAVGTEKDPYYQKIPGGSVEPRPCRQSYVVLLSDGIWNSGPTGYRDPLPPAKTMHTTDLRTQNEMPSDQKVNFYTIYSFSNDERGRNSMKEIAMYGGFTDLADDTGSYAPYLENWPYNEDNTGTIRHKEQLPSTSLNTDWPLKGCCKCLSTDDSDCEYKPGTYSPGCEEWAYALLEQNGNSLQQVGMPKNFFYAADGAEIEKAFVKILSEIESTRASASAVATVSQEVRGKDVILRGVFQSADTLNPENMVWYGHLEWYFPYIFNGERWYRFREPCAKDKLCYEDAGGTCPKKCMDAAELLYERVEAATSPDEGDRTIFTAVSGSKTDLSTANAATLKDLLDVSSENDAKELIKWVHGKQVTSYRNRTDTDDDTKRWILADIVYSTPVIVSAVPSIGGISQNDPDAFPPAGQSKDPAYFHGFRNKILDDIKNAETNPATIDEVFKQVVYVGGNDGMLHAFVFGVWDATQEKWVFERNNSDDFAKYVGKELWAYIPSNLLSNLRKLAATTYGTKGNCVHRTMVDLSTRAWQVWIDHNGTKQWRTVILGGERGGGDLYFCLDVTDPDDPKLLWEFSMLKDLIRLDTTNHNLVLSGFSSHYDDYKDLPFSWSRSYVGRFDIPSTVKFYTDDPTSGGALPDSSAPTGKRHVAFIGGGFRYFDSKMDPDNVTDEDVELLRRFNFVAIDIETGKNLFRYVWEALRMDSTNFPLLPFPDIPRGTNLFTPYSPANPLVLDVWNASANKKGDDGFIDHIYVGDLTGRLYGFNFNFGSSTPKKGFSLDIRLTKGVDESAHSSWNWSRFRAPAQPITVQPAATIDGEDTGYLRVIFGAGKYDDVLPAGKDDKTDPAKMSLYNLKEEIKAPDLSDAHVPPVLRSTNLNVKINEKCDRTKFNTGCTWSKDGGADNCLQSGADPCWECVYDLLLPEGDGSAGKPGERFVSKALIAGGLVFITSYVPPDNPCSYTGEGYLYVFDYLCHYFPVGFNPVPEESSGDIHWFGGGTPGPGNDKNVGLRLSLGAGVPSQPVLDSSGEHVIIQLSTGELSMTKIDLIQKTVQVKGWKEIQ